MSDAVRQLVNEQVEDEGLWFVAETAPEAYLQQELRRLHALIEATTPAVEQAYFDGYKSGLANEVDDWNAPDDLIRRYAAEYAARPTVLK